MAFKRIYTKTKNAKHLYHSKGVVAVLIKSLEMLQKDEQQKASLEKVNLNLRVKYSDLIALDLSKPPRKWQKTKKSKLTINWLMPPPGPGSGGHMNIFRFIKYLEDAGHTCRIYLYADGGGGSLLPIKQVVASPSYPRVKANICWLRDDNAMDAAEAVIATSWESAYAAFNSSINAQRFYFVQDFEPYFYPQGSMYKLAENTYRFGFHAVTAGKWLANKLKTDYKMNANYYDFAADTELYTHENDAVRKEIFFYARPYTERRGFEIGVAALDIFHKKHPDYTINFAGWDTSNVAIPFPYRNLKTLDVRQLSSLYNRCAASLVLSYTNMSLLPLELLSCGSIPVVNDALNNRMVSNNKYILYCKDTPREIADALSEIVEKKNLQVYSKNAAKSVQMSSWSKSGEKFVKIIEEGVKK